MHDISIVAGSFDPIQKGHIWLIKQAALISKQVIIAIGTNPAKKYMFTTAERASMIWGVLSTEFSNDEYEQMEVDVVGNELLAAYALRKNASLLVRGIRNPTDFQYECQMMEMNRVINVNLETVFFVPPAELTKVSSSTVKELVGYPGWKTLLAGFAGSSVIDALEQKLVNNS